MIRTHRPLAPGLDLTAGGLAEDRDIAREQVGASSKARRGRCVPQRPLPGVEHVGDVDRRGRVGRPAPTSPPGQPSCPAEPTPHSTSPSMRAIPVAVGRHGVGVARQDDPGRTARVGARHQVVADPGDLQVVEGPELGLDPGGDGVPRRSSPTALDQIGGQLEEIGVIDVVLTEPDDEDEAPRRTCSRFRDLGGGQPAAGPGGGRRRWRLGTPRRRRGRHGPRGPALGRSGGLGWAAALRLGWRHRRRVHLRRTRVGRRRRRASGATRHGWAPDGGGGAYPPGAGGTGATGSGPGTAHEFCFFHFERFTSPTIRKIRPRRKATARPRRRRGQCTRTPRPARTTEASATV